VHPIPAAPLDVLEIFLQPGEFYFGDRATRIRTLLGSCVAIAVWHPVLRIGGLCHFMLPYRPQRRCGDALDGRYADEALLLFMAELRRTSTAAAEYRVKLFGGGRMFERDRQAQRPADISQRNVEAGRDLLATHGFGLHAQDLGGHGHRNVVFDLWSGDVWMRRVPLRRRAVAGA
jgi:chemotaxis protein CheD